MRILLIEDNLQLSTYVRRSLEGADFAVDGVGALGEARDALDAVPYDAVVLELTLPDGDGLDLLHDLRDAGNHVPVIIASGRERVDERIHGLNAGADDYLPKPYAVEELTARLRAVLRRPGDSLGVMLKAGNLTFDTAQREVWVGVTAVKVSHKEMSLLEQLMRRAGHVVPKDVLEHKIYSFEDEVTPNSLEAHVSRLRKRLKAANASPTIVTQRGVGYKLAES
ncbi:MAG: response regulator transcription factor [Alphaproteobacteria bacterium]|nr:response regulator transcription factor [Alphaproteobacteria bacterium]